MCPKSKLFLPGTCCFTAVDFLDIFVVFSNGVINEGRGRGNEGWRQPRIITAGSRWWVGMRVRILGEAGSG